MKTTRQSIDLDAISPPCSRVDQWLLDVGVGNTTLAFEDWFVARLSELEAAAEHDTETWSASGRTMKFSQGPVEFELVHGACYAVVHPQKGTRHFRCILDGHFPMIAFYRPGTLLQFPWITMARVFVADELRSLTRVA